MLYKILSILPLFLLILSCRETGTSSNIQGTTVIVDTDSSDSSRIFIEDRTGKKWDVTHAVRFYKFKADGFQFGSGPFAIKPILNPIMLSPGDTGYPAPDATIPNQVIGTTINGDTRAYPLDYLDLREIANDSFKDTHVAVGF